MKKVALTVLFLSLSIIAGLPFLTEKNTRQAHAEGIPHYRVVSFKLYKHELQLQNVLNHHANSGWEYMGPTPTGTGGIFKKNSNVKFVPIVIVLGEKNNRPYLGVFTKETKDGMVVHRIENNGPSSYAGIQLGCVFLEIDGLKANQENFKNTMKALTNKIKRSFLIKARQGHGITYFRAVLPNG
jgi:C-terminal processing protease CtpA/Prc